MTAAQFRPTPLALLIAAALLVGLFVAQSAAAQEDPFGAAAPKPPEAGAPAVPANVAGKEPPAPEEIKREPLVIELLRSSNPTTAAELFAAARMALQYGRPDEAKRYLAKLLADKPSDEALSPLAARYADFLLQLTNTKDVQPEGKDAADLILAAAERVQRNPELIAASIKQLSDPNAGMRQQAFDRLAAAGTSIVNPLLAVLTDNSREAEHPQIRAALVGLGSIAELPLLGVLESTNNALKLQTIAVLARMRSKRAAVHLIRPALDPAAPAALRQLAAAALARIIGAAPDLYEGERYLRREAQSLLRGEVPFDRDVNDFIQLWWWNEAAQAVEPILLPRLDASLMLAARAAADLSALKPTDIDARRLMLLTHLELAKVLAGLDQPLPMSPPGSAGARALAAGPQAVSSVLAQALRQSRVPAAIAAAEVLGHSGDSSVLHMTTGASPLADAMLSGDARVRLAAALTVVKLAPGDSFEGAGRVADTLARCAATSGKSAVLVGHPRGEEAQALITFANALGYDADGAYAGRELTERAFANPDYDFALISDAIDSPPVEELVQWLRRDFRTARLPIGIMARGERLDALREALADDPFTTVFPRIHSIEVAAAEVNKLKAIAGRNLIGRDERIAQARAALAALGVLALKTDDLVRYDLLRHDQTLIGALNQPALSSSAAAVLAQFGTPKSQWALVELASQNSRPLVDRQAAAAAFAAAVKARGLLLTQAQIAQQYERYNASASLDQPSQELLGGLLDTIEAPALASGALTSRE